MERKSTKRGSILLASLLIGIFFVIIYFPNFCWLVDKWRAPQSYYSHGFIVPFVSLYLIWRKRDTLCGISLRVSKKGLWIIIFAILMQWFSVLWRINFTSSLSMLILISGLVLYIFGGRVFREVSFPIFFLIFMIPLPLVAQTAVIFKMKLFATASSVRILNLLGVTAIQEGSTIHFVNDSLIVGNPCSGLRSLISMLAFTSLVIYLLPINLSGKMFLFVVSVPVALLINIFRIVSLGLVTNRWNARVATGLFHTVVGFLIFVAGVLFVFLVGRLLQIKFFRNEKS